MRNNDPLVNSPYVFDTRELARRPGAMREVSREVTVPERLGTDVIGIDAGECLRLDLRMESVTEGVLMSGTASGRAIGECTRCLDPVVRDVDVPLQELFAYPDTRSQQRHSGDDSNDEALSELCDNQADIEPVVRDAVVLALPFQPLCNDDCPGLCSECGINLASQPQHQHDVLDPRWAALQQLVVTDDHDKEN